MMLLNEHPEHLVLYLMSLLLVVISTTALFGAEIKSSDANKQDQESENLPASEFPQQLSHPNTSAAYLSIVPGHQLSLMSSLESVTSHHNNTFRTIKRPPPPIRAMNNLAMERTSLNPS
eukprot:Blabericola_migrator_1__442@NODE_1105_length_5426_cov_115_322635_g569_i1_p9_GENE_NODE_1105_length_5426_cov_115_322635_g569_i1NODE_1105_length_5426_cov_115_322635_g569_i1_p9_ORF_typecomplete_len119_score28_06_NODE_1105_length_5426_cov_115_322635_g569_i149445300